MVKRFQFGRRSFVAGMVASLLTMAGLYDQAEAILLSGAGVAPGGGGPSLPGELVRWTVTNNTAGAMTNVPIEVPITFSPSGGAHTLESDAAIEVVDNDGTTVIPVGEFGRYSDLAGPDIRGMHKLVCILPNLGASQARELTVRKVAATSPTSGTDATAAQILATGFTCPVVIDHYDGSTYTADVADGLGAGSTWVDKETPWLKGKWITGIGFATSYIGTVPYMNGATPALNNLTLWFEVTAYKNGRGAVDGGNPITAIRVQYWTKSAYAQESDPENHWFDMTATCGSNSQAWVGSSPAKDITMSVWDDPVFADPPVNSRLSQCVFNVPAGGTTFTPNSVGMFIGDGTGQAIIVEYVSATVVNVRIVKPFSGTTVTSGTWRIFGLHMAYSADVPKQEIWYGGGLAINAQPNIDSSLGVAWTGSVGGPGDYFIETKMILPFSTAPASITNSMTRLSLGNNPCASVNGYIGDWTAYQGTTGGRDDIAPIPGFYVGPLRKWDSNAKAKIMGNAIKYAMFPQWYIDEDTGKALQFDNGVDYFMSSDNWSGTRLPMLSYYLSGGAKYELSGANLQIAHHPCSQYIPALITGDYYFVESLHQQVFGCWAACNPGYHGSQMNRMFCNASEFRGNAWTYRDMTAAILLIPDAGASVLSYTRSHLTTILGNQFTATNSGTPNVSPYPGVNIGLVNNTGPGELYAVSGYRGMGQSTSTDISQFQLGYALFGFAQSKLMGMITGDFDAFMTWMMEGLVGAAISADVNQHWFMPIYYGRAVDDNGTSVNEWADVYKWSSFDLYNGSAKRLVTGTGITLSGLSGSGITVTMPTGYFTTGGSDYVGAPVVDRNACSLQIIPMGIGTRAGFDEARCYQQGVSTTSGSRALPATNSGSVKVWNSGANPVYAKLSNGAGTATTSDTLISAGAYAKFTVGANTHINYISTGGFGEITVMGSSGASYAISDTIALTISGVSGSFSITTDAVVTVTDVGVNGDVIAVSISTPGLYIANSMGNTANDTVTHLSTSGSGTGFVYRVSDRDSPVFGTGPLRYGVGKVTAVSGDQLTLTTSGTWRDGTIKCYPFAQTGLVTNKIQTAGPQVGDTDGPSTIANPYLPTPYTGQNEFWTIALNMAYMADYMGYPDGDTAYANIAALYSGSSELKWKVAA